MDCFVGSRLLAMTVVLVVCHCERTYVSEAIHSSLRNRLLQCY